MTNAIDKYRDTYRIVTQVSRYVSHREIRYRDNTIIYCVISVFPGFFVRRILLAFDKLSFCQVTALHGRYKAFYSQGTGSQTDCAGTDSREVLDISNISDSSISFMEMVSEEEHNMGKPSIL